MLTTWVGRSGGRDGRLYEGAGAVALGGKSKLLFAWPLDEALRTYIEGKGVAF